MTSARGRRTPGRFVVVLRARTGSGDALSRFEHVSVAFAPSATARGSPGAISPRRTERERPGARWKHGRRALNNTVVTRSAAAESITVGNTLSTWAAAAAAAASRSQGAAVAAHTKLSATVDLASRTPVDSEWCAPHVTVTNYYYHHCGRTIST